MDVTSDRRFRFEAGSAAVWAAVTRVDHYRAWWPWLREFDGTQFAEGVRWRCAVRPPLPYTVHLAVTLVEVVAGRSVRARVDGDVVGWAHLTLGDTPIGGAEDGVAAGAGCELRLVSRLTPERPLLRALSIAAPPVARFGHDRVLTTGAHRFGRLALPQPAGDALRHARAGRTVLD